MSIVLFIIGGLSFIATVKLFIEGTIGAGIFGLLFSAALILLGIYLKKRKDKKKAIESATKEAAAKKQRVANLQKQASEDLKRNAEMFGDEDKTEEEE